MHQLDPAYVRESLRRLSRVKPKVFGADEHEDLATCNALQRFGGEADLRAEPPSTGA